MKSPLKIKQRKIRGLEWGPQVKQQPSLLAQFTQGRLRGRRKTHVKREAKTGPMGVSSLWIIWGSSPSSLEDVFSFTFCIELICNTGLTEEVTWGCNTGPSINANFCCNKTEPRKLHTPPTIRWFNDNIIWYSTITSHIIPTRYPRKKQIFNWINIFFFKTLMQITLSRSQIKQMMTSK